MPAPTIPIFMSAPCSWHVDPSAGRMVRQVGFDIKPIFNSAVG